MRGRGIWGWANNALNTAGGGAKILVGYRIIALKRTRLSPLRPAGAALILWEPPPPKEHFV